jgi:hypothetical protein
MSDEEKKKDDVETEVAKKIAPEIVRTILQDGVDFEITSNRKSLFSRKPVSRKFIVYPIKLGVLFYISKIILSMKEMEPADGENLFAAGIKNITENKDKMIEIVALGIVNQRLSLWTRLRKWRLARYIDKNLSAQELLRLVKLVIMQMDVTNFLASFVSVKRLNLMEATKKKATTSTIGESSGESLNISDSPLTK